MMDPLSSLKELLARLLGKKGDGGDSEDPYSYVGAPLKPKPSARSAAASVEPE